MNYRTNIVVMYIRLSQRFYYNRFTKSHTQQLNSTHKYVHPPPLVCMSSLANACTQPQLNLYTHAVAYFQLHTQNQHEQDLLEISLNHWVASLSQMICQNQISIPSTLYPVQERKLQLAVHRMVPYVAYLLPKTNLRVLVA